MGKCLVTQLKGIVSNDNLLKIGEMRIGITKVSSPTQYTQGLAFAFYKDANLKIVGNGYFTDKTLTENKGKSLTVKANKNTVVYVSNGDYEITISDKYSLYYINDYGEDSANNMDVANKTLSIDDLKYTSLNTIRLNSKQVSGDISALKDLTSLNTIVINSKQVSGDISALKDLTSLNTIRLNSKQVSGDISALKDLTSLTFVSLSNTQVSGDISALKDLTSLTFVSLSNTQVSGDISALKDLTSLSTLYIEKVQVSGDISSLKNLTLLPVEVSLKGIKGLTGNIGDLPDNILFVSNNGGSSKFTWTNSNRRYILALEFVQCDSIDKMLQDMSRMEAKFGGNNGWFKSISLIGTRTSASDAAVQTLQNKGYTVSITPA